MWPADRAGQVDESLVLLLPVLSAPAAPGSGVSSEQEADVRLTGWLHGQVQGVGMRWWIRTRALELGLRGSAANLEDGRVEVVAEGSRRECERLVELLRGGDPPGTVDSVVARYGPARGELTGFVER